MSLTLYELAGADGRRFSPYCWRSRMALAHKGLDARIEPVRFTEKDRIAFSGQTRVPVLVDGETVVADSWRIAEHLEASYPDRPSLFGGEGGHAATRVLNAVVDRTVHGPLARLIVAEVHEHVDPADRAYFRETREAAYKSGFAELHATRDAHVETFQRCLSPFRLALGETPFLGGAAPAYSDYILFGAFQWARCASRLPLLAKDDPLHAWRARLQDAFDGLARSVPGYEV